MTEAVAFDAEPLVAYLDDEPGSDVVEEWIDRVASSEVRGYVSPVTKTEVLYVGTRVGFAPDDVRAGLDRLEELGVTVHPAADCWQTASRLKLRHAIPLGDAFSAATAHATDAVLLVGPDDDFDGVESIDVVRFRDQST